MSKREDGSSMELRTQSLAPQRPDPSNHMATGSRRGSSRHRIGAAGANVQAAEQVSSRVGEPVMAGSGSRQPQCRGARRLAPPGESRGADREAGKLDRIATNPPNAVTSRTTGGYSRPLVDWNRHR